jgi:predicted aldo/keto reductase-like oxidoreductase
MQKVRLGKSELRVTQIGFGGIPIQRLDDDDAVNVVRRCLSLGLNYLDTANSYTTSERRIGLALNDHRGEVIVSTKSQSRNADGVRAHLEQSLQMLGLEAIDLYQFHNVSTFDALEKVLAADGPFPVVEQAVHDGTVRHIGITSHQIDVAKEAIKTGRFETVMYPLNFIAHEPGEELLALARSLDVGFIAMKPFAGGMIADASLASRYLLNHPDVVAIPGVQSVDEIEEIVRIAAGSTTLTDAEMAEIERLRAETGNRFCRRCDYCQPCTAGIPISTVMSFPTMVKRMPRASLMRGWVADALEKVHGCTDCGLCEERCPYGLPIREMISENLDQYEAIKREWRGNEA